MLISVSIATGIFFLMKVLNLEIKGLTGKMSMAGDWTLTLVMVEKFH